MKPIMIAGTGAITLSLILYSLALIPILKNRFILKKHVLLLSIGLIFELIAVIFMSIGSNHSLLSTQHGLTGLAGLFIMSCVLLLSWKTIIPKPNGLPLGEKLFFPFLLAYLLWIAAYISGAIAGMNSV